MAETQGQQHPIGLYLQVWGWLFVLSFFSYLVDYNEVEGFLRWFLVILFMMLKAWLIIAVFMHMQWERASLRYAVFAPPVVLLILIFFLVAEGGYISLLRALYFGQ